MRIQRVDIKSFGKFQGKEIAFAPGINIIYGGNESGKSTLHTFVRGIFFGMRRMRGRASRNDLYTRYEPWEYANWYEGTLWFHCGEKEFRIHRVFQKDSQQVQLVCETDGELLSVPDGDLDVLLGNINEIIYNNTVSIGQMKSRTEEGMVEELRNFVSNYQGSMDEDMDLSAAKRSLSGKKKEWEKRKKQQEEQDNAKIKEMELQMSYVQREIQEIEQKEAEHSKKFCRMEAEQKNGKQESPGWKFVVNAAVAALSVGILIWGHGWIRLAGVLGLVLALCGIGAVLFGNKKRAEEWSEQKTQQQEKYRWLQEQLMQNKKEKQILLANNQDEYRQMLQEKAKRSSIDDEIEAIDMAMQVIDELTRKMQSGVGVRIRQKTGEILYQISGGKYSNVSIREDFSISVDTGMRHISAEHLSRGTLEQIYFAFRMAMGEVLCREEELPLLLDDVFVMYDENRLANTLRWLDKEKEQVLIFTCQKREREILESLGIPYHYVVL